MDTHQARQWRWLIVVLAAVENFLFGGLLFGWGSLVFVLKQEGIFAHLCHHEISNTSDLKNSLGMPTVKPSPTNLSDPYKPDVMTTLTSHTNGSWPGNDDVIFVTSDRVMTVRCVEQDDMLSLCYSVSSAFLFVGTGVFGFLSYKLGTRNCRLIGWVCFTVGSLLIAFTSPDHPWLLFGGLAPLGYGGIAVMITDIQIGTLFDNAASTVIAAISGIFDSSSAIMLLVKSAHENGFQRRDTFLVLCGLHVLTLVNTLVLMPRSHFTWSTEQDCVTITMPTTTTTPTITTSATTTLTATRQDIPDEDKGGPHHASQNGDLQSYPHDENGKNFTPEDRLIKAETAEAYTATETQPETKEKAETRAAAEDPLVERQLVGDHLVQDRLVQDRLVQDPLVQDHLIQDRLVQDHLVQDRLVQDSLVQDRLVQDRLVQDPLVQDTLVEGQLVGDPEVQDRLVQDRLVQDPLVQDPLVDRQLVGDRKVQDRLVQDRLVQDPLVQDPLVDRQLVGDRKVQDPLVQDRLVEDPPVEGQLPEGHPAVPSLKECLLSTWFLLEMFWLALLQFRFSFFLAAFNPWLNALFPSEEEVSHYTNVFMYCMLMGLPISLVCGALFDFFKHIFAKQRVQQQRHMYPSAVMLALTSVVAGVLSVCVLVGSRPAVFMACVMDAVLRSFLYSVDSNIVALLFPPQYLTALFGVLDLSGGIVSLLQYAFVIWFQSAGFTVVNGVMLAIVTLTFVHPVVQLYGARRMGHGQAEHKHPTEAVALKQCNPTSDPHSLA
ncbi:hypothetical protein ACOMHN_025196 [Nucella lapillus]